MKIIKDKRPTSIAQPGLPASQTQLSSLSIEFYLYFLQISSVLPHHVSCLSMWVWVSKFQHECLSADITLPTVPSPRKWQEGLRTPPDVLWCSLCGVPTNGVQLSNIRQKSVYVSLALTWSKILHLWLSRLVNDKPSLMLYAGADNQVVVLMLSVYTSPFPALKWDSTPHCFQSSLPTLILWPLVSLYHISPRKSLSPTLCLKKKSVYFRFRKKIKTYWYFSS